MKISKLRDVVVAACFVILMALIVVKVEEDASVALSGRFRVVDGDSLDLDGRRLRLMGIDAPELSQTCGRHDAVWHCGDMARQRLNELLTQGEANCTGNSTDRYGRLLVTCRIGDLNINAELVLQGAAVAFGAYEDLEAQARQEHRGIWAGPFVRPAEWRHRREGAQSAEVIHRPSWLGRMLGYEW